MRSLEGTREDQTKVVEEEVVRVKKLMFISIKSFCPWLQHGVLAAHIKTIELVSSDDADGKG